MPNATVAQSINRQTVAAALREARIQAQEHQQWINAINKAAVELEASSWAFDGEVLRVASRTGNGRYTVTAEGCECKAAQAGRVGIGRPGGCCARRLRWCSRHASR